MGSKARREIRNVCRRLGRGPGRLHSVKQALLAAQGGGTLLRVMLAWALFRSTPGLPRPCQQHKAPLTTEFLTVEAVSRKAKPFTGCEQAPEWAAGMAKRPWLPESRGQLACHHGDRHQALRAGVSRRDGPKGSFWRS